MRDRTKDETTKELVERERVLRQHATGRGKEQGEGRREGEGPVRAKRHVKREIEHQKSKKEQASSSVQLRIERRLAQSRESRLQKKN